MHLIACQHDLHHSPFYHGEGIFTSSVRPDSLPHIFKALRIHRNLTRRALSEKFGTTEGYINQIETGHKHPSLKYCLLCAQEFDINPEWVKRKWFRDMVISFEERLKKRIGLES